MTGRPPLFDVAMSPAQRARRYRARRRGVVEAPIVSFRPVPMATANEALVRWNHKHGPVNRPRFSLAQAHGLFVGAELVAVTTTHQAIAPTAGGLLRAEVAELSRLVAAGPHWCRVALRLWREVVLPSTGRSWGVSYSDNAHHKGALYRHDGWTILGHSRSGTDTRSGRPGRDKVVWGWRHPST